MRYIFHQLAELDSGACFGDEPGLPVDMVMDDGGRVYLESGIPESVRAELRKMGHNVVDRRISYGGYQAIMRDDVRGVYFGASESRKDGQAAGY